MGRELQKKKNRSSIAKVKSKTKSKKLVNPRGNAIVAANWYVCPKPRPETQVHH
jgi:nucleolar protein 16